MKEKFAEFIKTPKGKLITALCAMLLSWVFLLWNFTGALSIRIPTEARKKEEQKIIKKLRAELDTVNKKYKNDQLTRKKYYQLVKLAWHPERDGDYESLLRQKVEDAAKKCEIKLNSVGTVRTQRINQDLMFAELDIGTSAQLEPLTKFFAEVAAIRPVLAWKNFSMNMMFQRPRQNQTRRVVSGNQKEPAAQPQDQLNLNGTLRCLVHTAPDDSESEMGKGEDDL